MTIPGIPLLLQAIVNGILMGGVYGLIAVGLTLIFGVMNIINFAHGAFMMLGMYATYWLYVLLGIDPYLSLLLTIPLLFIVGLLIERFLIAQVLDAPGHNQLLLTLGISLFIENFAICLWSPNFRTLEIPYLQNVVNIGTVMISIPKVIAFLSAIIFTALLYYFLKKTDMGKAIRAASEEKEGALTVGINLKKIYYVAFGIGAACVGAAGTVIAPFFYVNPHVGGIFVIVAFVVVVLGGMGNFIGAFFAGLIIGLAESVGAAFVPGQVKQFIIYFIFILVLLFKPEGLFGRSNE
ncbi:MAG: branched-chain amino acid ABC transporter permease [Desulfobacterales bacterium S7086C20]|nr:MAG: branched-chain amino acid ABC transporter permease [Desulfobacterales bacterium S7086C20]